MRAALLLLLPLAAFGQGNYEVQVYGAETTKANNLMVEVHSNFTFSGVKRVENGVIPTEHALHETLELTQGWNEWFETGFYVFSSYNHGYGWQYVGSHLRPRVRIPEEWHWPVGLALSLEAGYQRAKFSEDTWTLEIRPIIDKQFKKTYVSFNPTVDRSFHGPGIRDGWVFSPNFKAGYDVTKRVNMGFEYYGSLGAITGFDPFVDQQQQFIPCVDLNLGPNWEFNFGVGVGVTHNTDHLLVKMILGRKLQFGRKAKATPTRDPGQVGPR